MNNRVGHRDCPICLHEYAVTELTRHHLVPKSRKGRDIVLICRSCHAQIHALFTEKELEANYGTLEKLLSASEIQTWLRWIRRRKPGGRIRARASRRKGRRN